MIKMILRPLIDADCIAHQAARAAEPTMFKYIVFDTKEEIFFTRENRRKDVEQIALEQSYPPGKVEDYKEPALTDADVVRNCGSIIQKITNIFPGQEMEYFLTAKEHYNHRYETAKTLAYKSNRSERPFWLTRAREYISDLYHPEYVTDCEADDAITIEQYAEYEKVKRLCGPMNTYNYCEIVACTIDKDILYGSPGHKYCWPNDHVKEKVLFQTEEGAWRFFYNQILNGDTADTVPGLKFWFKKGTIGDTGAKKLLASCNLDKECYTVVRDFYMQHVLDTRDEQTFIDRITEMGQLVWIMREQDKLWSPPLEVQL